jgi:hypothetical protein
LGPTLKIFRVDKPDSIAGSGGRHTVTRPNQVHFRQFKPVSSNGFDPSVFSQFFRFPWMFFGLIKRKKYDFGIN